jgi:hypothetical protein
MADRPKASIVDLAWIIGVWNGTMSDEGQIQEVWSMPEGGTLMGMFQWLKNGQPYLFEFMLIEPRGEGVALILRHINPGSIAWEDKDAPLVMNLVQLSDKEAVFERQAETYTSWVGYRRASETQLTSYAESLKDGQRNRADFIFNRQ